MFVLTLLEFTKSVVTSVFNPIALFDADGMRVSREKSFNNDREANVSLLNGGINIPAGSSVELHVRASVDKNKGSATAALAIESPDDVSSNASSVSVSNATTELARLSLVKVAEFTVANSGSTPDVSVGDRRAQVARFEMTSGDEDMHLHSITLEQFGDINAETEMSNFVLEIEGKEVASTPYAVDDYVSFLLDTPYEIEEDDTAQARVYADILDGAGDDIEFRIESDLDVLAIDQAVKQPANVDSSDLGTSPVKVQAGELTIVASDASFTEFGRDQQNLVLGYVDITPASGESIELKNITLGISGNNKQISNAIDVTTVEAVTENGTFDLAVLTDIGGANVDGADCADGVDVTCTFQAKNIDLAIKAGSRVWFRADSADTAGGFASDVTLSLSLSNLGTGDETDGLYFKEVNDDTVIKDITPSSITFEDVTSEVASATIRSQAQSAAKTVVQGTDGVVLMKFEIEAGDASYLDVDTLQIAGAISDNGANVDDADFQAAARQLDSDYIDSVRIYHTSVDAANLIDEQGGNEFAAGLLEFDFNDYRIAAGETTSFVVVADINDNDSVAGHYLKIAVDKATIRDSENDTVALNNATDNINETDDDDNDAANEDTFDENDMELSRREVKVAGTGTLTTSIDNTDSRTDRASYVLAGAAGIVGSLELTTQNEGLTLEDFSIVLNSESGELSNSQAQSLFSEVRLLDSDLSVLATSTVAGRLVEFSNENIEFAEGTRNLYIEVVTNEIGKDKAGAQSATNLTASFFAEKVRGQSLLADLGTVNVLSGDTFYLTYADVAQDGGAELTITVNGTAVTAASNAGADAGANEATNMAGALEGEGDLDDVIAATASSNIVTVTAKTNLTVTGIANATTANIHPNAIVAGAVKSNQFGVLPVHITDVNTVASHDGVSVSTTLQNGVNRVAILELSNGSHTTTQSSDGTRVDTAVSSILMDFDSYDDGNGKTTTVNSVQISRVGSNAAPVAGTSLTRVLAGQTLSFTVDAGDGNNTTITIDGEATTHGANADDDGGAAEATALATALAARSYITAAEQDPDGDNVAEVRLTAAQDILISSFGNGAFRAGGDVTKAGNVYQFDTSTFASEANKLESGETGYFLLEADVVKDPNNDNDDFVKLSFDTFTDNSIVYTSDSSDNNTNITKLRLSKSRLVIDNLNE